jgi:hypothetical protein
MEIPVVTRTEDDLKITARSRGAEAAFDETGGKYPFFNGERG